MSRKSLFDSKARSALNSEGENPQIAVRFQRTKRVELRRGANSCLPIIHFRIAFKTKTKVEKMRVTRDQFKKDCYYHIYNHAVYGSLLFKDKADYHICMKLIKEHYKSKQVEILALCLMPNHYHILLKQLSDTSSSEYMNIVWLRYARYYNKRYQRKGSIFSGKAQHIMVDADLYLTRLIAYIHNNPVAARLVGTPMDWQWSSFLEWAGKRELIPFSRHISEEYLDYLERHAALLELVDDDRTFKNILLE